MPNCDASHTSVLQVAIAVPLPRLFDYLPAEADSGQDYLPGIRLWVPFGRSRKVGVLVAVQSGSAIERQRLKRVEQAIDTQPLLSTQDLQLLQWASRYYHHPIGEVMLTAFPVQLRHGKMAEFSQAFGYALTQEGERAAETCTRAPKQLALLKRLQAGRQVVTAAELAQDRPLLKVLLQKGWVHRLPVPDNLAFSVDMAPALAPNPAQQQAIDAVSAQLGRFSVFLLQGVTGSGKTEVYMQIMAKVLALGLQVLVLLPEITLTPQLEQRFRQRFATGIVCFHSKLSDGERTRAWLTFQRGQAGIMLGTRSALFTPMPKPGLIILDEEHDSSFKQQDGFRFSARDVAVARGKLLHIPVLLGSATPSLESLFNVRQQRYRLLELPGRAGAAEQPNMQILDIRNHYLQAGLSEGLLQAMRAKLQQGQQVLLFLNRRGYAPVQICHACGWVARCRFCDANLVIHAAENRLRCHHCGASYVLTRQCPACKTGEMRALGAGTERIEQELVALFPEHTVVRLDRDSTQRKGTLETYLQQINAGAADIILGTQMLAKGHHFPNVTLAALLDIDSGLFSIDFRSSEKLAQLIVQVAGRAGRGEQRGTVILQTRHPQHPLLSILLQAGYSAYVEELLNERRQAGLPPYTHHALLRADAKQAAAAQGFLAAVRAWTQQNQLSAVQVLGPVPAPMSRRAGQFRFQLLLQSPNRKALHGLLDRLVQHIDGLEGAKQVHWSLDVDPADLS
ncbi:primosomal protein N' [Methylomonas rhizoryzae]|uniref:primosomal protein N' n=1 Tax=Methylomonas rhizoryzae TaxID=2608981 RepID=UPI001231A5DE|nr:primosomal protein N' [Methylomonas rhizoryzae]